MNSNKLRIVYIANARIPGIRAHSNQIVHMCEAFEKNQVQVTLLHPQRYSPDNTKLESSDIFTFYGIRQTFAAVKLFSLDLIDIFPPLLQRPFFILQSVTFVLACLRFLVGKRYDFLYVRDPYCLFFLAHLLPRSSGEIVYEAHSFPRSGNSRRLLKGAMQSTKAIVVLNKTLKEKYDQLLEETEKTIIVTSGVSVSQFQNALPHNRQKFGLKDTDEIACYAGSLYSEKGINVLLKSAELLPHIHFLIVGGGPSLEKNRKFAFDRKLSNVTFTGFVTSSEVPSLLLMADILVLPNSGKYISSSLYTSPMKLFEYLTTGKPIVATDLPALKQAAHEGKMEDRIIWIEADSPRHLADGIRRGLSSSNTQTERNPHQADLSTLDWRDRAEKILVHLTSNQERPHG